MGDSILSNTLKMKETYILGQNQINGMSNSNVKKVDRKLKSFLILLSLTELSKDLEEIPENKNNKIITLITKFFKEYKIGESTDEILLEISQFIKTDNFELIISDIFEIKQSVIICKLVNSFLLLFLIKACRPNKAGQNQIV